MSDTPTDRETDRPAETDRRHNTLDTDLLKWVSGVVVLAGLGLIAYPFLFEATALGFWNDVIAGVAVALLAGYNFLRLSRDRLASVGVASLTALFGLWALISPMLMEMGSTALAATTAFGGAVTLVLSGYNAYANSKADAPEHTAVRA